MYKPVVAFAAFVQWPAVAIFPAKPIVSVTPNAIVTVGIFPNVIVNGVVKVFLHWKSTMSVPSFASSPVSTTPALVIPFQASPTLRSAANTSSA